MKSQHKTKKAKARAEKIQKRAAMVRNGNIKPEEKKGWQLPEFAKH
jgi:hypothetical protein